MSSRKTICWAIPAASAFLALVVSGTVFSQQAPRKISVLPLARPGTPAARAYGFERLLSQPSTGPVLRTVRTADGRKFILAHAPGSRIPADTDDRLSDPEMVKLAEADAEKEKEALELVKQYKAADGEEPQAEVREKLEELVNEHFDIRQKRRELEISRLEARLEQIRASFEKRSQARQLIVDRHIAQLLGLGDDLAF